MARRVNKRVLSILIVVLLGGTVAALVSKRFIRPRLGDPKKLVAEGNAAYDAGDYLKARDAYMRAMRADPAGTDALLRYGDASAKLTPEGQDYLRDALAAWSRAIALDPGFAPAIDRLLDLQWDYVELIARGDEQGKQLAECRKLADQLLAVEPDNKKAAARKHIATVRQWLASSTVPAQDVEKSQAALLDLAKKDPGNPDLPYWVGQVKVRQGQDYLTTSQTAAAQGRFDEAAGLFDAALAAQPDNGPMHLRAAGTFWQLDRNDPRTKGNQADDRYRKRVGAAIDAAQRLTTDKDEAYADVQLTAEDWYNLQGNHDRAKEVVRAFYDSHPDLLEARLAMARILSADKTTRDRAVEILTKEPPDTKGLIGFKLLRQKQLQERAVYNLATIRLDELSAAMTAKDEAKAKAAEAAVAQGVETIRRLKAGTSGYYVPALQGKLHLLRGQNVEAVKVLGEAVQQRPGRVGADGFYTMYMLARANLAVGQPGPAKALLDQVVEALPDFAPARLRLAQLTFQDGDVDGTKKHLAVLRAQDPDNAEVKELDRLTTVLSRKDDPAKSDATFKGMGESTADERTQKARVALVIGKPDEAVQLYQANLRQNPKDIASVQALVEIYEGRGQSEKVAQVVADALKQNPDNASLKLASLRLQKAKPEQIYAEIKPLIEKTADEVTREMQFAELERATGGGWDKVLPHVERAYQLRPGDRGTLQTLYAVYVGRRDWAKAEQYLKELEKANADQVGGMLLRQEFLMAKGDLPAAEELGRKLADQYKDLAAGWLALARAQHAQAKYAEAAASYAEVRRRDPRQYQALRGQIDCYYQVNRPEDAAASLAQGRQLFPNDPALREMYLSHLVTFGNPADAIPDRKKGVDERPDDPAALLALGVTYSRAAQRAGPADPKAAAEMMKAAEETARKGTERFPDDARFYDQEAEILHYGGRWDEGEKLLNAFAARESARTKPQPQLLLANFYLRQGKAAKAEEALAAALAKADREEAADVRLRLAAVQTQQGKFPQALATLAADPADTRVVNQRIETLVAANDPKAAEAEADAALKKQDSAAVRNLRAGLFITTGRVPDALKDIEASRKLDPKAETTRYLYALALAKKSPPDTDGAIGELIKLVKGNPGYVQARGLLAQLYFDTGRFDQGVSELADGLAKVPLARDLRLMLVRALRAHQPPDLKSALALCQAADKDPVLRLDPAWGREAAMIFATQKKMREALLTIDQVVGMAPDNMDYQRDRLDIIQLSGDFDAVVRESDKLLARNKDAWWLRYQRGVAFGQRGEPDPARAVAEFDRALALVDAAKDAETAEVVLRAMAESITKAGPDGTRTPAGYDEAIRRTTPRLAADPDNRWHVLLIDFYRTKGDAANAAKVVEQVLADPSNKVPARRLPLLRVAALIYHQSSPPNLGRAREVYAELLNLAKDDLLALNNYACLLAEDLSPPDPAQAKIYSTKAYDLTRASSSPSDVILDTHGWVLTLCGGYDAKAGLAVLKDLATRRPDFLEARYHLGESYLRQPTPEKALALQELQQADAAIRKQEAAGQKVDPQLKAKIQSAIGRAGGQVAQ